MRWIWTAFAAVVVILFIATIPKAPAISDDATPAAASPEPTATITKEAVRGVWIASVYNLDFPSAPGLDNESLKKEIDVIISYCGELSLTDLFVQVRPMGDALYDSALFPWSVYLTGGQGLAPSEGFDPLLYWIDKAHENGMRLHAWVNPLRLSMDGGSQLADSFPDWTVEYNNRLYLDPGIPEVRDYIAQGVGELCEKYDIDGVHFDDYFYPGRDFNDASSRQQYGDSLPLDAWRVENINALIRDCGFTARSRGKTFGVSPSGIWANVTTRANGSRTSGSESLTGAYADSLRWAREGWVDYLAPQIYWEFGHPQADFETLARWWADMLSGCDIELYIGLAAYKQADADIGGAWSDGGELDRQLEYLNKLDKVGGVIYFNYTSLRAVNNEQ